jgi:cystathionine beta-synthase
MPSVLDLIGDTPLVEMTQLDAAQDRPKRVVSFVCDSGAKYLSKVFNPTFIAQEGWDHRELHGTVRDVVVSNYPEGSAVVLHPSDTLRTAFARMRTADVSQLPVVEGERIVGLVDESDMLASLMTDEAGIAHAFARPVKDVMTTRLETISADAPVRDLVPLFRRDLVAIVMDGSRFLGLATRIDLINYFRIAPR